MGNRQACTEIFAAVDVVARDIFMDVALVITKFALGSEICPRFEAYSMTDQVCDMKRVHSFLWALAF